MARYNVEDVLDRVWNDSGNEGSISDSDHTPGNSNSDGESEEWSGNSAETSESSNTESGNESEESDIYTCQLSRLRRESHACGLKTSISRRLTLAGQFLTPDWKM